MTSKKLFLIDAYALIYRSYYAFIKSPRITSTGINTSAIFGFTNTLNDLLQNEKPDYLAIGFDVSAPTFRHKMYPEYKANREETPEGVRTAVPYIRRLANILNIPIIEKAGFEADDVLGTVSKRAEKNGFDVYIMTPDKDYGQLIDDNIKLYKPRTFGTGFNIIGRKEICEKYGITSPLQIIDILALWGDASDNVPGIEGIGEKTACKLIGEYGSIEGIYKKIEQLKGKQKEKIEQGYNLLKLSKELVTIVTDIDMEIDFEQMKVTPPNEKELNDLFVELEFRNLRQRFAYTSAVAQKPQPVQKTLWDLDDIKVETNLIAFPELATLKDIDHDYQLIETVEQLNRLTKKMESVHTFSFDTETTGIDAIVAEIVGFSVCCEKGKAFYTGINKDITKEILIEKIKIILENKSSTIIGQNLKYDLLVLRKYEIETQATLIDTMLAHYLLEPDQRHNIDLLAQNYLNWQKITTESLIGKKGYSQLSMSHLKPQQICDYACEDADTAFRLWEIFQQKLQKMQLTAVFETVEMPLVNVLVDMEYTGINVDTAALDKLKILYQEQLSNIEHKIYEYAGYHFNIASPKQLGELLFDRLKVVEKPKLTKTKQYATGEEVLVNLRDKHPIIEPILEYRELVKLLNTYIEALPKLINPITKRIHTSYNQAVTNTGRLSSSNPNLQNIPVREARGRAIRTAFVPADNNHILLAADYSQIELRIMAHLSEDPSMLNAFEHDMDIHQDTASKLFHVAPKEVTKKQRSQAKGANFGIIYGISAFGLSQNAGLSQKEAKNLIENYFKTYPKVKEYMNRAIENAKKTSHVETIMGRKRNLPDINSANAIVRGAAERYAINAPIQGSSADMIKLAMIAIKKEFDQQGLKSKMILQVHDELVFDVPLDEIDKVKEIVNSCMVNAIKLRVKLKVDMNTGNNWLEAH